jgi:hypothetical protein
MSVKRACECERALKVLKGFKKSHNGRIALKLNVAHPPVTTSGNYSYDHGQSQKFTNQVGNKNVLPFPMQVPSAHA